LSAAIGKEPDQQTGRAPDYQPGAQPGRECDWDFGLRARLVSGRKSKINFFIRSVRAI
jgi:hypothetical protein